MLYTDVTKLRKEAPGSLTLDDVAAFFSRRRFPRSAATIGAFERTEFKKPSDRFFELYAECVGQPIAIVRAAYARTRQLRERKTGPFSTSSVA